MEITFFQGLWFLLIFVLIAGYFVLDGFDLGAGVLYPFVAKGDEEKAVVRTSIGPVWDGNEVWLLTAGGALFAAFPAAYATTFSGFYLAVMLVLFGLIVRAVSLEYRGIDHKWAKVWDGCFFVGSLLPALLLGVAVGNIYAGIPMSANGDYTGIPLLGLITPFTLLCGLLGLSMFLAQGASWLALKAPKPSDLQARAAKLRFPLQIVSLVLFVAVTPMLCWAFSRQWIPCWERFAGCWPPCSWLPSSPPCSSRRARTATWAPSSPSRARRRCWCCCWPLRCSRTSWLLRPIASARPSRP